MCVRKIRSIKKLIIINNKMADLENYFSHCTHETPEQQFYDELNSDNQNGPQFLGSPTPHFEVNTPHFEVNNQVCSCGTNHDNFAFEVPNENFYRRQVPLRQEMIFSDDTEEGPKPTNFNFEPCRTFKVYVYETSDDESPKEIRRFSLKGDITFDYFKETLSELMDHKKTQGCRFTYQYKDDEGDIINVDNDLEFQESLKYLTNIIKYKVTPKNFESLIQTNYSN